MNYKLFILAFLCAIGDNSKIFASDRAAKELAKQKFVPAINALLRLISDQAKPGDSAKDVASKQARWYVGIFRHCDVDSNPGDADIRKDIKREIEWARDILEVARMGAEGGAKSSKLPLTKSAIQEIVFTSQANGLFKSLPPLESTAPEKLEYEGFKETDI